MLGLRFTALIFSFTFALVLAPLLTASSGRAAPIAPATDAAGPLKTQTAEYRLAPGIDPDVLEDIATEVWARAYWPKESASSPGAKMKRPLIVMLHGNHGTCGRGTNPREDSSCSYTNEGTCPAGYVVTPNHEGYAYTAENLASWGYIVVSINANRGITCGGGGGDDWGLVLARGRLVLKHLQLWSDWSTSGGAPSSLGDPKMFVGRVDLGNVGLMGHSRGGEGVRAALNLYRDPGSRWVSRIPKLDIKAIFEIGAVDGQSNRVLDAPSVAWTQLLPLCDGDVSDLQGRLPFERMMNRFSSKNEEEARPMPKSLFMTWGANHNFFNTEWQESDAYSCDGQPAHAPIFDTKQTESRKQKAIALQSMNAFFRAHVGEEAVATLGQNFDPAFEIPSSLSGVGKIDRDFVPGFELKKSLRVDDFTSATGLNPSGAKNTISNVDVEHEPLAEPPVANITWKAADAGNFYQLNFASAATGIDVSAFDFLDFRVGKIMNDVERELLTAIDFSVQLISNKGAASKSVEVSKFTTLNGPPSGGANLTQTVRIPLGAFTSADLKNVSGVRFVFDRSKKGSVRTAQVRFGVSSEKITTTHKLAYSEFLEIDRAVSVFKGRASLAMDSKPAATTPPDLILSGHRFEWLSTPFSLPLPRGKSSTSSRASWLPPRKVRDSSYLKQISKNGAGVELVVATADRFPVADELAVLNIEGRVFPLARFPSNGETDSLIFSIPMDAYRTLPAFGRAQVQYGLNVPSRVWTLPDFSKSETDREIGD